MISTWGVGDFALELGPEGLDMVMRDDDVVADEGLRTATLLSLFVDRRAEPDDELPGAPDDRRGWWGDQFLEVRGDQIGSRRWLLERAKRSANIAQRMEEIDREALAWMKEDSVATKIEVAAETDHHALASRVVIHRPDADATRFRFPHVWDGESEASEPNIDSFLCDDPLSLCDVDLLGV